jgi:hypothetical protein
MSKNPEYKSLENLEIFENSSFTPFFSQEKFFSYFDNGAIDFHIECSRGIFSTTIQSKSEISGIYGSTL